MFEDNYSNYSGYLTCFIKIVLAINKQNKMESKLFSYLSALDGKALTQNITFTTKLYL